MQSEPSTTPERKMRTYLKMLKVYGLAALGILVLFSAFGFFTGGVPGLINGLNLALIVCAIGLPFLGMLISLTYWSEFAGRWGEEQYKEQLEGKTDDKKNQDW
ncbi:MAG: DUF2207 domain-containing protein [Chloroflexi bacterium]|jgi:hypothetical protein|nr:DUF2207 domain-containing protein [Chloroflexota bacterium]